MPARTFWFVAIFAVWITGTGMAQIPPPPPASPTIWSFLGIPQGLYKLNSQLVNRRGNFPKLEKKPPLKAIADVSNLKSEVPAIKAAAEIKQAEDLKPQKIKAIKYLATIGCGCYDKDEKVTKALLAATDDCTEDVRLAAVQAVELAAAGEACEHCKQKSCCNEKLVAQLSKMAYEKDDMGCWVEPSERVREAAVRAARACCPGGPPIVPEAPAPAPIEGVERPVPPVEGVGPSPGDATDPPPPLPMADPTTMSSPADQDDEVTSVVRHSTPRVSSRRVSDEMTRAHVRGVTAASMVSARVSSNDPIESGDAIERSVVTDIRRDARAYRRVNGQIVHAAPQGDLFHLHLRNQAVLPVGTRVKVYRGPTSRGMATMWLEVTESETGWANARLTGSTRGIRVSPGDEIEAWH